MGGPPIVSRGIHPMIEYTRRERLLAALVSLILFVLGACTLTPGTTTWGDDNAAYINEGVAIAEGHFSDQVKINYYYHPSDLPDEAENDSLVYAWGYPLLLSVVYRIVGFDRVGFSSVIWYKIPSLLCLSLTGGVLTLFLRRRFSRYAAAGAAIVFCMSGNLFEALNGLYSDLSFLFFSMLTFFLMEYFAANSRNTKLRSWLGLFYGITLWMTYETRLSGFTVCGAAMLGHIMILLRQRCRLDWKDLYLQLLPYLVMGLLILISEHFWLAPATQNLSDIGKPAEENLRRYYQKSIFDFFDTLPRVPFSGMGYVFLAAFFIGLVVKGFRENLYLTLLLIGTLAVDLSLPYKNGLRYLYNVLPIMIMYCLYGFQTVGTLICRIWKPAKGTLGRAIVVVTAAEVLFFSCANQVYRGGYNIIHWGESYSYDMYSPEAKEIYRFIQEEIPEDSIIAFGKPRALYLNTGRMSFRTGQNGHQLTEADYYLKHKHINLDDDIIETAGMEIIMENNYLVLYQIES